MKYKDYYKIMGLARTASDDEIKRAYRKLARKYHPDVSKEPDAEERFKELGEAHEVLRDATKRAAYDRLGSGWKADQEFKPPPGWDTAGFKYSDADVGEMPDQFSDFFSTLFGHGFQQGRRSAGTRLRGQDQHAKILISLDDAHQGATRIIQLGVPQLDAHGDIVTRNRALQVKIPAGVIQGQQIRLAAQGSPGIGGGGNGDLYLEIDLQPHPLYQAEGRDIHLSLPLTPWEAALGTRLSVPTLGGKVEVKIPPGSQTGQKLRLKGRGLGGKLPGDQYIVLQIVVPPANTPHAKELYEKMAQEMEFNPRSHMGV